MARRTWAAFRALPIWAQAAAWIVATVVLIGALSGEDPGTGSDAQADGTTSTSSVEPSTTSTSRPATTTTTAPAPSSTVTSTTQPPPTTTTSAVPAVDLLAGLTVADESAPVDYERSLFAHWSDLDGDGCDTRCEVLEAERRTDLPGLSEGGWFSVYDGYSTDDPSELEIDHVVALSEAWRSGAWAWDMTTREAFANDTANLRAVTAATNRSKSDRDPTSWQPPNRDGWCDFATTWTATKLRWGLTAQAGEANALRNMLAGCAVPALDVTPAPVVTTTTPPPPTGTPGPPAGNCDPSYPTVCIPPAPPDLNCGDIPHRHFTVLPPDPHRFDGNSDGVGCEG